MPRNRSSLRAARDGATAALAVRLATGYVFIASGALKFLFDNQGPARFARIGLPWPGVTAHAVGTAEILCGALLAAGWLARPAAAVLALDMCVALALTKLPLFVGPGPEPVAALPRQGALAFAYQARLDLTMLAVCAGVVAAGAGAYSLDAWLAGRRERAVAAPDPAVPETA